MPDGRLVNVRVKSNGFPWVEPFPEYQHEGQTYIVGQKGDRYCLEIEPLQKLVEVVIVVDEVSAHTFQRPDYQVRGNFIRRTDALDNMLPPGYFSCYYFATQKQRLELPFTFGGYPKPKGVVLPRNSEPIPGIIRVAAYEIEIDPQVVFIWLDMSYERACKIFRRVQPTPTEVHMIRYKSEEELRSLGIEIQDQTKVLETCLETAT